MDSVYPGPKPKEPCVMLKYYAKSCLILLLSAGLVFPVYANSISIQEYINTYSSIAVKEMQRGGVPASITLSQGILESSFGNSALAVDAKNHFGIKCHSGWEGDSYWKYDDEATPSCFRVYCSPTESFIDHTNFLTGRERYADLFLLDKADYMAWARGLQEAGYATADDYAEKLVRLIRTYQLYVYDTVIDEIALAEKPKATKPMLVEVPTERVIKGRASSPLFPDHHREGIFINNNLTMVITDVDETLESISKLRGISLKNLRLYNDLNIGEELMVYQFIYLEPKRNEFRGPLAYHVVQADETMYIISQIYGIQLDILMRRNQLRKGEEPATGQRVYLRGGMETKPTLR